MCETLGIVQRPNRPRGRRTGVAIDPGSVRRAREEAGLSQAQVGGSELTRQAVHLIETGKVRPSMDSLCVIANRLGRPISAFLVDEDSRSSNEVVELDHLCQSHRYAEALEMAERMLEGGCSARLRAYAHEYAGQALSQLGRLEEALNHLVTAQQLAESVPDAWLAAEALDWQACVLDQQNDLRSVEAELEALRRYRALPGRRSDVEARMLEHLASFLIRRKSYQRAQVYLEEALDVVGPVRDLDGMARIYHDLAGCSMAAGDLRRATELMRKAHAFYSVEHELRPAPSRLSLPKAENDLGMLEMELGHLEHAESLFRSALERFAEAGNDRLRTHVLLSLGELRQRQGRLADAFAFVDQAIALSESLGYATTLAEGHQQLGELHAALGEHDLVDQHFSRAIRVLADAGLQERQTACERAYHRLLAEREASADAVQAPELQSGA